MGARLIWDVCWMFFLFCVYAMIWICIVVPPKDGMYMLKPCHRKLCLLVITLSETNIAPETVGLKDELPLFQKASRYVNFRENRRTRRWPAESHPWFWVFLGASNSVGLPFLAGLSPAGQMHRSEASAIIQNNLCLEPKLWWNPSAGLFGKCRDTLAAGWSPAPGVRSMAEMQQNACKRLDPTPWLAKNGYETGCSS